METGSDGNQNRIDGIAAFDGLIALLLPDVDPERRQAAAEEMQTISKEYPLHQWPNDASAEVAQRLGHVLNSGGLGEENIEI